MATIDLTGKIAIVTGAGSGLGQAMALALVHAGGSVLALDVAGDRLEETVAEAKRSGARGRLLPLAADVRSETACAAAVKTAQERLGGLTGLVNCAGLGPGYLGPEAFNKPPKFWEVDPLRFWDIMDVNVRGPFLLARAAMPALLANGWGRVVNVTTSFNTMLRAGQMPYGQSKAALEAASSAWADDTRGTGVTVNILVPGGAADTRLVPQDSPFDRAKLVKPEVMAAPIVWLMSSLSDGTSGMRFVGNKWDAGKPWQEAMQRSGGPIAWPDLAAAAAQAQPKPAGRSGI